MDKHHLKEILIRYWGYSNFRPLQEDIIQSVLEGKDTLALLPTGGGKSICFQVPALALEGCCLVISPLIALMKDQVEQLKSRKIPAEAIYSGLSNHQMELIYNHARFGKLKFLYVSPERLLSTPFLEIIRWMKICMIAVDEAHCISQWGYDFRPPYLKIEEIRKVLTNVPILAVTATATPEVVSDIMEKLNFKSSVVFQSGFERKNLAYRVLKEEDKLNRIIKLHAEFTGTSIIYVRNRRKTIEIAQWLKKKGINADFYHAGLDNKEREKKQVAWTKSIVRTMVSTNAFGMGIDKPDVRLVIHYDLPDCPEAYFQEAGRAGRDQKPSVAYLLWDAMDINQSKQNFENSFPEIKTIKEVYQALGNFLQIPTGAIDENTYDFELAVFSEKAGIKPLVAYNSIRILEKDGYVLLTETELTRSQIMFVASQEELYKFQVENPAYDPLIKLLLRTYGGLFSSYVAVSENFLAEKAGIPIEKIIKGIQNLDVFGLLKYIPSCKKPQFMFCNERYDVRDLSFSENGYYFRKKQAAKRLNVMLQFIGDEHSCRSSFLLKYFGQNTSERCGQCDACLLRNAVGVSNIEFSKLVAVFKKKLKESPADIKSLLAEIRQFEEHKALIVLQWLVENNKIEQKKDGTFLWNTKE